MAAFALALATMQTSAPRAAVWRIIALSLLGAALVGALPMVAGNIKWSPVQTMQGVIVLLGAGVAIVTPRLRLAGATMTMAAITAACAGIGAWLGRDIGSEDLAWGVWVVPWPFVITAVLLCVRPITALGFAVRWSLIVASLMLALVHTYGAVLYSQPAWFGYGWITPGAIDPQWQPPFIEIAAGTALMAVRAAAFVLPTIAIGVHLWFDTHTLAAHRQRATATETAAASASPASASPSASVSSSASSPSVTGSTGRMWTDEFLVGIIDNIADPIFVKDRTHRWLLLNRAFCEMWQRQRREMLGRSIFDFLPHSDAERFRASDEAVFLSGIEHVSEEEFTAPDGRLRILATTKTVFADASGRKLLIGVIRDVTDAKHGEDELLRAKMAAEGATEAKSHFLASMSHEVRTPMNAITGMTTLLRNTELSPEQREYVAAIRASSKTLLRIINDILDFSKIEAGKLELESATFSLAECVDNAIRLVKSARDIRPELRRQFADNVPERVIGDVTRLQQILINLLNNAAKFTEHGHITVHLSALPISQDHWRLRFQVSDTGIGIPADRIDRLFEPFRQVDASTARKFGGSGLGLAICKHLCDLMGGGISVSSIVGQGTTFHFDIVVGDAEDSLEPVPMPVSADMGLSEVVEVVDSPTQLRMLVAEDNLINQQVMMRLLNKMGFQVDIAPNGVAVIEALRHHSYDVIFMDVQMPEMDGLETTQHIRRDVPSSDQPRIIGLTANAMAGDRKMCLDAGMDDYLSKPISYKRLRAALAKCVPHWIL